MHLNPGPMTKMLASIRYVREKLHYRVGPGPDFGVMFDEDHAAWVKNPRASHVSPLGAAILQHQPQTEEVLEAAQLAIGCESLTSVLGLIDGMSRSSPRVSSLSSVEAFVYVRALEVGHQVRARNLTTVCPEHKLRHLEVVDCPACKIQRGQS